MSDALAVAGARCRVGHLMARAQSDVAPTPDRLRVFRALVASAQRQRGRLSFTGERARRAGIWSAIARGVVGDSRWGHRMHGLIGGRTRAAHSLPQLLDNLAKINATRTAQSKRM